MPIQWNANVNRAVTSRSNSHFFCHLSRARNAFCKRRASSDAAAIRLQQRTPARPCSRPWQGSRDLMLCGVEPASAQPISFARFDKLSKPDDAHTIGSTCNASTNSCLLVARPSFQRSTLQMCEDLLQLTKDIVTSE